MVAGDFNVIPNINERLRGVPLNEHNMEKFNETIFYCGLVEVDFEGSQFTWTNGTIWQCLDKALVKEAWLDIFGITKVSYLIRG